MNESSLRIAYYCSSISWGGLEMNTLRYAEWYSERGVYCHLYCVENSPLHEEVKKTNVPFTLVPRNKKYVAYGKAFRLSAILKRDAIDVLIFSDNRDFSLLSLTKAFFYRSLKLVYYQAMLLGISKKSLIHTWRFNRLDRWVTLLPFLEQQVLERTNVNPSLMQVIPLGTPTPLPSEKSKEELSKELKLDPNKDWIGIVGRLDKQKGQLDALKALSILRAEYGLNVGIAFIGEPTKNEGEAYVQELQQFIETNQLQDSVVFCGHRSTPTTFLPAFIQLWVPSWNETYGTVTIEGMASEVPTLGANSAGTAALINNPDALFQPKNPASIAEVSFSVSTQSDKKEAIVAHQQSEFKRLYSKEASLKQWMKLLLDLKSQK